MKKNSLKITPLISLPLEDIQPLLEESRNQGFEFLDRLVTEYQNGQNQFNKPGETLIAIYTDNEMIAIGGLNIDPYLTEVNTGRVRHVYVLSGWRRQGIGTILMEEIIRAAKRNFSRLTLRTFSARADKFYRELGFQTTGEIKSASHWLDLH